MLGLLIGPADWVIRCACRLGLRSSPRRFFTYTGFAAPTYTGFATLPYTGFATFPYTGFATFPYTGFAAFPYTGFASGTGRSPSSTRDGRRAASGLPEPVWA